MTEKTLPGETLYVPYILRNMPRILSQVNRDPDMRSFGSCDRNYWHLKIRDFSSAILQQTCLTLALVWKVPFSGNPYYQNANVYEWALAALRYMNVIQLWDGSFNEYYPNEHAFPPTAFDLFAGCRTYRILGIDDERIRTMLGRSAKWLCAHDETKACNQQIASVAGLYEYYRITKEEEILESVHRKIRLLADLYCSEGWFPEQGGADIGYSSVALDMLTEYYEASRDESVRPMILGMVDFLSHFIHPDGTAGGEYGSRNTIYFLPAGLEACRRMDLNAGTAQAMAQMLYGNDGGAFMDSVDERYLSHYVMHSYLRALDGRADPDEHACAGLPFETIHRSTFPEAGLSTVFNGTYYAVIGEKKGGLIKVYRDGREVYSDFGYRIPLDSGKTAVTNWIRSDTKIQRKGDCVRIRTLFSTVKPKYQTPVYHALLRTAALIRGGRLREDIKKITIFQDHKCGAAMERTITLKDSRIFIEDAIINATGKDVVRAPNSSLRLVASGRFFSSSDLISPEHINYGNQKRMRITRTVDPVNAAFEEETATGI